MTNAARDNAAASAELWQRASAFATRMHAGQFRKDNQTPYASHPARVAMALTVVFGCDDPNTIASAFLHDTIEDTPADYDDIADGFGTDIADIVAALTKNMILPEDARERDYDDRLAQADWRARLINSPTATTISATSRTGPTAHPRASVRSGSATSHAAIAQSSSPRWTALRIPRQRARSPC